MAKLIFLNSVDMIFQCSDEGIERYELTLMLVLVDTVVASTQPVLSFCPEHKTFGLADFPGHSGCMKNLFTQVTMPQEPGTPACPGLGVLARQKKFQLSLQTNITEDDFLRF